MSSEKKKPRLLVKFLSDLKALEEVSLRFTPPKLLNDPFEMRPSSIKTLQSTKSESVFAPAMKHEVQEEYDNFNAKYGILSFSAQTEEEIRITRKSPIENLLLWGYYSNGHKGIAMVLDATHPTIADLGNLEQVTYSTDRCIFRDVASQIEIKQLMLTKSIHWRHEYEWRIIEPLENCTKITEDVFVKYFDPKALSGLLVGAAATEDFIEEVKNILTEKYPQVKSKGKMHLASDAFRAIPLPFEYPEPYYIGTEQLNDSQHAFGEAVNIEFRPSGAFIVTDSREFFSYQNNWA